MDGFQVAVMGITMVFLVLGVLATAIWIAGLVVRALERIPEERPRKIRVPAAGEEKKKAEKGVDPETVAAITAAVSSYLGGAKFRLVSVEPVRMSTWKEVGLMRLMRRYGR